MKIIIQSDLQTEDKKVNLVLEDDSLETDSFVEMYIGEGEIIQVPLDQLMSAVIAFESKRSRRLSESEKYEK